MNPKQAAAVARAKRRAQRLYDEIDELASGTPNEDEITERLGAIVDDLESLGEVDPEAETTPAQREFLDCLAEVVRDVVRGEVTCDITTEITRLRGDLVSVMGRVATLEQRAQAQADAREKMDERLAAEERRSKAVDLERAAATIRELVMAAEKRIASASASSAVGDLRGELSSLRGQVVELAATLRVVQAGAMATAREVVALREAAGSSSLDKDGGNGS